MPRQEVRRPRHPFADDEPAATIDEPAPTDAPPEGPAEQQVAAPGRDGDKAEALLAEAKRQGISTLAKICKPAFARLLASDDPLAADALFNAEESRALADALAATNATANLLGRSRIRLRQEKALELKGARKFSDDPTDFSRFDETLKPMQPESAVRYFKSLVPTMGGVVAFELPGGKAVRMVPHENSSDKETMVKVPVDKLNAAWAKEEGIYIPPGGGGAEIGGRIEDFKRFLAKDKPVQASRVYLAEDGSLDFIDGRHRFAVLRDSGAETVGVMVPDNQAAQFQQRFGAEEVGISPYRFGAQQRRDAFTLAVTTDRTLLSSVQDIIRDRIQNGQDIKATKDVIEELLGQTRVSKQNSQYSEMVMRTNMLDAYNQGADEERMDPDVIDTFPVWKYSGIDDGREREEHKVHFGKYYPANVPFATVRDSVKLSPWNCRCTSIPIFKGEWESLKSSGAKIADGYEDV